MINVTIEGGVRRKSPLHDRAKGKYFSFYLFDEDNNAIRIVAFKGGAVTWFDKIDDKKWYRIGRAFVVDNVYNNVKELQIVLGSSEVTVAELESQVSSEVRFTPLCALNERSIENLKVEIRDLAVPGHHKRQTNVPTVDEIAVIMNDAQAGKRERVMIL